MTQTKVSLLPKEEEIPITMSSDSTKALPNSPGPAPPKKWWQWKPKMSLKARKIFTIVILVIVIIALIFFLKRKRDNTLNIFDLFGDGFDLRELPQLAEHPVIRRSRNRTGGINEDYRTYNPCLFTLQGEEEPYLVYRVCNFSQCPGGKNPWSEHYPEKTHSHTYIGKANQGLFRVKHGSISSPVCEQGCEDARSFVCGDRLYLVCNVTSGTDCRRRMVMMELDIHQFQQSTHETDDNVRDIHPLSLRRLNLGIDNDRDQKNWMPLVMDDQIYFVYSVNPHIIIRYNGPLQDRNNGFDVNDTLDSLDSQRQGNVNCVKVAETFNPKLATNLRGGGQIIRIRKWNPIFTAKVHTGKVRYVPEDLYLGIIHSRDSHHEYSTYFYAFEAKHPFRVKYMSRGFVFGEKASHSKRIQFASGLARIIEKTDSENGSQKETAYLYVTYGEHDCNGRICVLKEEDVLRALHRV